MTSHLPDNPPEPIRLSKLMAQRGLCSRREADRFIEQGLVQVDGKVIDVLGTRIDARQIITLTASAQKTQLSKTTVLLNKPPGYVSGLPEDGYTCAVTLITRQNAHQPSQTNQPKTSQTNSQRRTTPTPKRDGLAPAGRLDIDSSGLIVFTNDGRIAKQLIGADSEIEKEYQVGFIGTLTADAQALLEHGLSLDGKPLKPANIQTPANLQTASKLQITLTEGRKRQIRRMCELVELEVISLIRTRIGRIKLADLPRGKWRLLGKNEHF